MEGTLLIGTSGYQFEDWFGTVYPPALRQRDVLEYYSRVLGFDTVEINYTYYRLPSARTSEAMVKKVPDNFKFAVRSYAGMTHDIWETADKKRIRDTAQVFDEFVKGVMPLREAGKLGPILLQFPYSFWPNRATFDYLRFCREKLINFDVVVEFRNQAWSRYSTFRLPYLCFSDLPQSEVYIDCCIQKNPLQEAQRLNYQEAKPQLQ